MSITGWIVSILLVIVVIFSGDILYTYFTGEATSIEYNVGFITAVIAGFVYDVSLMIFDKKENNIER